MEYIEERKMEKEVEKDRYLRRGREKIPYLKSIKRRIELKERRLDENLKIIRKWSFLPYLPVVEYSWQHPCPKQLLE